MIQEEYTSYEQAKALKELGFPIYASGKFTYSLGPNKDLFFSIPTLTLAQKWLREEKNISIELTSNKGIWNTWVIYLDSSKLIWDSGSKYTTYEKALSEGINKCIELLKEK